MWLNNRYQTNAHPISILDLIQSYKLIPQVVAITINGIDIAKTDYATTFIHDQDQVTFHLTVSGG